PIEARLEGKALAGARGAHAEVTLRTTATLRALLRGPLDGAQLAHAPIELRAALAALPLAALAPLAPGLPRLEGTVAAQGALTGTAAEPNGTAAVDVAGAASTRFPPTDARIELGVDRGSVTGRARVARKGRTMLAAEGRLGARWQSLRDPAALGGAPF